MRRANVASSSGPLLRLRGTAADATAIHPARRHRGTIAGMPGIGVYLVIALVAVAIVALVFRLVYRLGRAEGRLQERERGRDEKHG